jgi:hypothetical protein
MHAPAKTFPSLARFDSRQVDSVALKAFFNLAAEWGLDAEEQLVLLGRPGKRTLYRWKAGEVAGLPADTLERISVLLGVYKALEILMPMPTRGPAWIRRANEAFGDRSALEVMLGGKVDDLYQVRRHLDAWRG